MLIAYDSRTGNVQRFVNKLQMRAVRIEPDMRIEEPFVLITYTTGFGQIPDKSAAFLKQNHRWMAGVAASGNRNWGEGFAKSADRVAEQFGVPVVCKFELAGTGRDAEHFVKEVHTLEAYRAEQFADAAGSRRVFSA